MTENEVPKSRGMVTGETPSGNTSETEPKLARAPVASNCRKGLEERIQALQDMVWIKNDKGNEVPFEGAVKEGFIRLCQQHDLVFAHAPEQFTELGALLGKAKKRFKPLKLYGRWLKFVGWDFVDAGALLRVYKRFGDHLHRFAYLGLKKLLLISKLEDCVGYVEQYEKAISGQPDDELEQLVMALKTQRVYSIAKSRGPEPTCLPDSRYKATPELDFTGSLVEGRTREDQRQWIQATACLSIPSEMSRLVLVDGQQDHIDTLESILRRYGYEIHKIVLPDVPPKMRRTAEQIYAALPDLVIMNLRPLSRIGHSIPYGHHIAVYLNTKFFPIPVVFYDFYGEVPQPSRQKAEHKLRRSNTVAFLTTPFEEREVLDRVMFALEVSRSRKGLLQVGHGLQTELASRAEELQTANQQLEKEVEERRRAEQSAIESKQQLQAVFDCAADAIFIKDQHLVYQMANPAMSRLLGVAESEIIEKTDERLFEQDAAGHFREVDLRVLNGEAIEEEYSRRVNGVELTFLESRVPLRNAFGEIVGICGISKDVTERRGVGLEKFTINCEYTSPAMRACLEKACLAAATDSIVLLLGESGSGKDHLARFIHDRSPRSGGPFFAINCAALPAELVESELFGHERGGFTGAHAKKRGLIELAEGGTLLLNEIGELSLPMQSKLLTFLDTKTFTRVGGETVVSVNARLVAATNRDLQTEVGAGRFRQDLYYRLNVMSIVVPPLRERRQDIPTLVSEIVPRLCADMQLASVPTASSRTWKRLEKYNWPGNVRELRNVLERALIISRGANIEVAGPEFELLDNSDEVEESDASTKSGRSIFSVESLPGIARPHGDMGRRPRDPGREVVKALHQEYLIKREWYIVQLAEAMKVHRTTLSKWFTKYELSESSS